MIVTQECKYSVTTSYNILHSCVIVNNDSWKGGDCLISGITSYGQQIQIELVKRNKTRGWLIDQLRERTGMYVDGSNLYKIMTGKIKSSALTDAINDLLDIKEGV